jgi:diguanylate cyclase (GGDEF)-like protein
MPGNKFQRAKQFMKRNRATIQDVLFLVAIAVVTVYLAFEYNIFEDSSAHSPEALKFELDEVLAISAVVSIGLLVLAGRFLLVQRREMARRIAAERHARDLALQDALTGLPNRRLFDAELKAAVSAPPRSGGSHAVLLLDLNHFKGINDVFGHGVGDEVLINVAGRLRKAVRGGDLVARLGGDEFVVLAQQLSSPEEAASLARRILKELDIPIETGSSEHQIGAGIGIALVPQDGVLADEILRKADIALYRAKAEPISASCFYAEGMDAHLRERDRFERELRIAVRTKSISLRYDPLVDMRSSEVIGFEAVPRWQHPTLGDVDRHRFIAVAEDCGLMLELGDQLLRRACHDASQWPARIVLSYNLSPLELRDRTLGLRIMSILNESGLAPNRLEIELTECAMVRDLETTKEVLGALRDAGVRIALTDFGTGYSSLYHLGNFKFDKIKIDRSFVDNMDREPHTAALARALFGLGNGLGLELTADGVERPEQLVTLLQQGCQHAQGHLFGGAITAVETMSFFNAQSPVRAQNVG